MRTSVYLYFLGHIDTVRDSSCWNHYISSRNVLGGTYIQYPHLDKAQVTRFKLSTLCKCESCLCRKVVICWTWQNFFFRWLDRRLRYSHLTNHPELRWLSASLHWNKVKITFLQRFQRSKNICFVSLEGESWFSDRIWTPNIYIANEVLIVDDSGKANLQSK